MLDGNSLRAEIDAALSLAASADAFVAEARRQGLLFLAGTRPGRSQSDVARVFAAIDARFETGPLFPSPPFDPPVPGAAPNWRDCAFIARLRGVSFGDISANPWDIAHAARLEGGFEYVRPDVPVPAEAPPKAPHGEAHDPGWAHAAMRIKDAWDAFVPTGRRPGQDILIGHPDSGVYPHNAFNWSNMDSQQARNFLDDQPANDARDRLDGAQPGHGVATASVMVSLKGQSVVGVAHGAKVLPIRCLKGVAQPPEYTMVQAIRYAIERKCRVISCSWGGLYSLFEPSRGEPLFRATNEAVQADIIVVAASGQWIPFRPTVEPALFAHVIGVAGLEQDGKNYKTWDDSGRWPWRSITVSAPAYQVERAIADPNSQSRYGPSHGTSYATALTAGVAAMWLSYYFPNGYSGNRRAHYRFKDHVQRTADRPSGFDDWFFGALRADKVLTTPLPSDEPAAGEESRDYCVFEQIERLVGAADAGQIERLLGAAVGETDRDALRGWAGEIASILQTNPKLRAEIASKLATAPLGAEALRNLIAPAASDALRARLTAAA